jgi:hypothetical protein
MTPTLAMIKTTLLLQTRRPSPLTARALRPPPTEATGVAVISPQRGILSIAHAQYLWFRLPKDFSIYALNIHMIALQT